MVIPWVRGGSEAHAAPSGLTCSFITSFYPTNASSHCCAISSQISSFYGFLLCFERCRGKISPNVLKLFMWGDPCPSVQSYLSCLFLCKFSSYGYKRRDHLTFLCVLCPVVAFIDGLLLFSSFFLPHIPLMADGNCCWRLSAQFQSPQPHHPLTIPVCCSCYNPFNQPELLYFISSPLVCFGLWGRGWRGEGGVKFPLWSQSRCGSEEGWGRFCRCAWSPGSSSLTSTEHDSSQMQLTLLESLKPSPLAVCPVEHSATSQGLGYGKANPINNKVTSNLINKQNWKNAEWVWKSGWNVRQGFLVIFTEASFISWISEVRERIIKGTTVKTAVTNTSQEGNLGFQNGKPLPVQRDLDDRITGGLVVYWFIALISKC